MSAFSAISRDTIDLKVRNMIQMAKPAIDISLNTGHRTHSSYVPSFSTMDRLEGIVSITSKTDIRFDDLDISFVGMTRTYVMNTGTTSGRTEATHRFLKLTQPIDDASLPLPRIAEAGRIYKFPFTFVIPNHLLPKSCSHKVSNDQIHQAHLQLPPSLGDRDVSGSGGTLLDDLAPEMARITYAIRVKLSKTRETDGAEIVLAEKSKKVRVTPAFPEQPPLPSSPTNDGADYRLRQEKPIKKGLFGRTLGHLVMQASQPAPFYLPNSPSPSASPVTSTARIALRFDPADEHNLPPRLGALTAKLRVSTFFASKPRARFPSKADILTDASAGHVADSLPLAARCVERVQWIRHASCSSTSSSPFPSPPLPRRDSGVADVASIPEASPLLKAAAAGAAPSAPFFTAELLVPLTLPITKHLVPTFHSCLVSRTYTLLLHLSLQVPGFGAAPSLSLKLPVQVAAERPEGLEEGSAEGLAGMSAEEAVLVAREAEREVERAFAPRMIGRVGVQVAAEPPEYEGFDKRLMGREIRVW